MALILPLEELDLAKQCLCYFPEQSLLSNRGTAEEEAILLVSMFRISKKTDN